MVAPSGNTYYVNDGSTAGDVYTTAVGNDNNTGKTANNPMASLAALLNVYKLQPGDIVYVDSGTYTLPTEITFGATQSGTAANPIRIVGAGATTILDRGTIASNASVFRFAGGHDISIESMVLKEGGSTVNVLANSGSTDVSLKGLDISGFSTDAVNVGAGDGGFSLTGSNIHDATAPTSVDGIDLDSVVNATVSGNTISRTRYGIYANNTFSLTISGNLFNLDVTGVEAYQSAYTADNSSIVNILGNIVTGSLGTGIDISASYGTATVRGNTISGATSSFGLTSGGYVNVNSNELFNNSGGIQVGYFNTVTNNNVHDNLTYGIYVYGTSSVSGNTLKNNDTGAYLYSGSPSFFNNTLINNKTVGISIGSSSPQIFDNTILQSGGTAILAANSNAATVKNNVFQLTGGIVFNANAVAVSLIASDYNLFDLEGAATFANWAGQAVADFNAWHFGTGLDTHSLTGNPQFTDAAHGNYILAPTSPGIDAGDPGSPFSQEPGFNGGRVNLGMEGNTARATQSASQVVQVLGPNGLDKLETGQPATITFRTDGVSGLEAAALLNSGGANVTGQSPDRFGLPTAFPASTRHRQARPSIRQARRSSDPPRYTPIRLQATPKSATNSPRQSAWPMATTSSTCILPSITLSASGPGCSTSGSTVSWLPPISIFTPRPEMPSTRRWLPASRRPQPVARVSSSN